MGLYIKFGLIIQDYLGFGLDRFHCIQIFLQDRIRSYMNRVKDIQDKANAPKVDKGAAKRFVKSSLWQAAKAKTKEDMPTKNQDAPIQIGK